MMRHALLLVALAALAGSPTSAGTFSQEAWRTRVARDLRENVLPFWATRSVDRKHGGFLTHLDTAGNRTRTDQKYLLMQARMIWVFSAAHRHGIRDQGYLALAKQGVDFLTRCMWDNTHDGFFWMVDREGNPLKDHKSVYTHTFVIYALAEYHLASGDREALAWAEKTFELLETKARHRAGDQDLGYRENFDRAWRETDDHRKTLDTHMHLMECFTTLLEASGKPTHRQALEDVTALLLSRALHPTDGFAYEPYDARWKPIPGRKDRWTTSYGHNVELAWLILEAYRILGKDREPLRRPLMGLMDHALAFGFDHERGGLALYGPHTGRVQEAKDLGEDRLIKSWWEQAELLVALVDAWQWTGQTRYKKALERQLAWVWEHQIDHRQGDWFGGLSRSGDKLLYANKGGGWKCAYHNARALMMLERKFSAPTQDGD